MRAGNGTEEITRLPPLRHAILGAGGVGGLIGASLARLGDSVTVVVRRESLASYPDQLKLESPFGNFQVPVERSEEVPPADVVWLAVKATQLEEALALFTNPHSVTAIVPLLNGIDHLALLRKRYGGECVIAATIAVESERVAPGHILHRSSFARLNLSSAGKSLLASTLEQFQKIGFECRFIDDEPTLMWSKAVFLAPMALATTAFDQPIGGVMGNAEWKGRWEACVHEACAVATVEGAKVDPNAVFSGMSRMPHGMRSSMQKDVEQGNTPELDAIAGPILRGGVSHGFDVKTTKSLVDMVESRCVNTRPRRTS